MKKILVTTDGSDNSKKALLKAKEYGELLNADIDILTVVENVVVNPYVIEQYYTADDLKKPAQRILKESLKFFEDYKGEISAKYLIGDPGNMIIKEVEKENYDLVVMGSRGLGTFSRAMLGSISNKVLNHVKTNVLIVK